MTTAKRNIAKRKSSKPTVAPQSLELATVRVHDLVGVAAIALPAEMRDIFGEETYQDIRSDINNQLMTMIVRRPGHIVYVHANLKALDLGNRGKSAAPATGANRSGDTSAKTPVNHDAGATSKPRMVTGGVPKLSGAQRPPDKGTAAKAGKTSGRQPKGKA